MSKKRPATAHRDFLENGRTMMIRPDKIYFDMDGVLADFNCGVREICGMEPAPQGKDWTPGCEKPMWEKIRQQEMGLL